MGESEACLESWDLQRLFLNRSVRSWVCGTERISICLLDAFQKHQPGTSKTTFPLGSPSEVPGKKLCLSMKAPWVMGSVWPVTRDLKAVFQQAEMMGKERWENCFLSKAQPGNLVMVGALCKAPAALESLVGKIGHIMPTGGLGWPQPSRRSVVLRLFLGTHRDL